MALRKRENDMEPITLGALFLGTGILLGVVAILFGIGPLSGKEWMTVELVLTAVAGSLILQEVAAHLPGGWLALVYTGVAVAVINQVPRWYFSSPHGAEILDMIGFIPPCFFIALAVAIGMWMLALWATAQFFAGPVSGDFLHEAALLSMVTMVSVVASLLARIIRV